MTRAVYVLRNGELVEKHLASPPSRHFIISDTMPSTVNPATGKRYDSKSSYYRDTRAAGCEIIGNDKQALKGPPKAKIESFATTVERLNQQKGWGL